MRLSIVLSVLLLLGSGIARADTVNIYAAASTADALNDILEVYEETARDNVVATFAASSTLARQIEAGAPADIFLSANVAWMDDLASRQRLAAASRVDLLSNRLVLVTPRMLPISYDGSSGASLSEALGNRHLALGDPDGVPAGLYAREALTALGEWDANQDNMVFGDSVRAALTWAARAEVGAAVVYASDTFATQSVRRLMTFDEATHTPIRYPLAIIDGSEGRPEVLALYEFLQGPEAAAVFEDYGFGLAGD